MNPVVDIERKDSFYVECTRCLWSGRAGLRWGAVHCPRCQSRSRLPLSATFGVHVPLVRYRARRRRLLGPVVTEPAARESVGLRVEVGVPLTLGVGAALLLTTGVGVGAVASGVGVALVLLAVGMRRTTSS